MTAPGARGSVTRHANSFDALRLIAASVVIVGHAFPVTGRASIAPGGVGLQALGVMVFFSISGYLITRSWQADPHLGRFWSKRALRIMPALAVVVLATALIVGPLATTEPVAAYGTDARTWRYIGQNLVLWTNHELPEVFRTSPYPYSVNTSLWTLPIEVTMYASTIIVAPLLARCGRTGWLAMVALAFLSAMAWERHPYSLHRLFDLPLYGFRAYDALGYVPSYLLGSVFAAAKLDRVPASVGRRIALVSIAALVVLFVVPHAFPLTAMEVPLTLATLYVGLGPWLSWRFVRRIGDVSYGTYLWGFLVQQIAVSITGAAAGPWVNIALSLPAAWLLGYASWRLIESPALTWKRARRPEPARS